jgi:type II secretory pathway component PulK
MRRQNGGSAERQGTRGVALLAVLWVLAGAGTAVSLGLAAVRDGIATSRYRTEHTRARWVAEGCLSLFRAALERSVTQSARSVSSVSAMLATDPWIDPRGLLPTACAIVLEPPGDGPVDLNTAPESTLLALPGFDAEVVAEVARRRIWHRLTGLDDLIGGLPADLRDRVAAHYAELVGRAAFAPPGWDVTGQGILAGRLVPVVRERWVSAGARVAVVRRELW